VTGRGPGADSSRQRCVATGRPCRACSDDVSGLGGLREPRRSRKGGRWALTVQDGLALLLCVLSHPGHQHHLHVVLQRALDLESLVTLVGKHGELNLPSHRARYSSCRFRGHGGAIAYGLHVRAFGPHDVVTKVLFEVLDEEPLLEALRLDEQPRRSLRVSPGREVEHQGLEHGGERVLRAVWWWRWRWWWWRWGRRRVMN